jgi:5-methylcytosine-specific restriction endonuclease McrA
MQSHPSRPKPASASRSSTTPWQRWYSSQAWRKAAKAFLAEPENVLCAWCRPRITRATQVHHEPEHHGNFAAFWDRSRWVPLCHGCHSARTRVASGRSKDATRVALHSIQTTSGTGHDPGFNFAVTRA